MGNKLTDDMINDNQANNSQDDRSQSAPEVVQICFGDTAIAGLFVQLLNARNIPTIIRTPETLNAGGKTITERQFLHLLDPKTNIRNCLVVENCSVDQPTEAITLSRPLTEDKIDASLRELLKNPS